MMSEKKNDRKSEDSLVEIMTDNSYRTRLSMEETDWFSDNEWLIVKPWANKSEVTTEREGIRVLRSRKIHSLLFEDDIRQGFF